MTMEPVGSGERLLVVAYDIADDRRRAKMHTLLLGYGVPVQESLFECIVSDRILKEVSVKASKIARTRYGIDKVHFYLLCRECASRVEGRPGVPRQVETTVVVV